MPFSVQVVMLDMEDTTEQKTCTILSQVSLKHLLFKKHFMQKSASNRSKEVNQPGFLSVGRKVVGSQSCHMGTNAFPCKTHDVVQHVFTCRRKGKSVLCQRLTKNPESVLPQKISLSFSWVADEMFKHR